MRQQATKLVASLVSARLGSEPPTPEVSKSMEIDKAVAQERRESSLQELQLLLRASKQRLRG